MSMSCNCFSALISIAPRFYFILGEEGRCEREVGEEGGERKEEKEYGRGRDIGGGG